MKSNVKKNYIIIIIAYTLVIGVIVFRYFNMPSVLVQKSIDYAETLEMDIHDALNHQYSERKVLLEDLVEKNSMDIVVFDLNTEEEVIATVPYKDQELLGRVNQEAVILEGQTKFNFEDESMYVWYSIYQLSDYSLMSEFYFEQAIAVMLSLIILIVFIFVLQKNLYNPLVSIKESLEKMDNYDLDQINGSYDVINEQLHSFSLQLAKDMSLASKKQTDLERRAALVSDRHLRSQTLVRSLIHDLKTPIQAMIIENQISKENDIDQLREHNIENYYQLSRDVNEILTLIKSDTIGNINNQEVNLIKVIMDIIPRFQRKSESKSLYINLNTPESLLINADETTLRMLISNLISNAINYSVNDSEIEVSLEEVNNQVILQVINDSTEVNIDRMLDSQVYFKALKSDLKEHELSSGSGLHLIKDLAIILNAQYNVEHENNQVKISIIFNQDETI